MDPNPTIHMPAAKAWSVYEGSCSTLLPSPETVRAFAGDVLALGTPVEWTFTWTRDLVHRSVTRLVSELSPAAVVLSTPRRHWFSMRPSLARWLIGRPNVRAVVIPA